MQVRQEWMLKKGSKRKKWKSNSLCRSRKGLIQSLERHFLQFILLCDSMESVCLWHLPGIRHSSKIHVSIPPNCQTVMGLPLLYKEETAYSERNLDTDAHFSHTRGRIWVQMQLTSVSIFLCSQRAQQSFLRKQIIICLPKRTCCLT